MAIHEHIIPTYIRVVRAHLVDIWQRSYSKTVCKISLKKVPIPSYIGVNPENDRNRKKDQPYKNRLRNRKNGKQTEAS